MKTRDQKTRTPLFLFGVLVGMLSSPLPAQESLPVPCGSCAGGPANFVSSGAATYTTNGSLGTINQQTERAILNWQSFNIGEGNTVNFQQPSADSAALNRIFQNDPSRILGHLNANGQVYLINQNGIIFGQGAQVNTHSLTASTLDVSDQVFNQVGVANAVNQNLAAFEAAGAMGAINVAAGAQIRSAEGGRVMILAPDVVNSGSIATPGGQTILAASSDRVYLTSSNDPNVRGLLVEVNTGGSVTNLGNIIAERGNITMLGLAVNQSGLARATTSVSVNGTVRLLARDRAVLEQGGSGTSVRATDFGTLTLGSQGSTEVMPDTGDTATAIDEQAQRRSFVLLEGRDVQVKTGANITAPNGAVTVAARSGQGSEPSRVVLESGSTIDVSGTDDVILPMSRNFVDVELRGNELRDAPLQRDGVLRNETVTIDIRKGTPLADVSGVIAGIRRSVAERTTVGGDVSVVSAGQLIFQPGATIDVSGGAVTYQSGPDTSTWLTSRGRVVNISEADPNLPYDGIVGIYQNVHRKWGVIETYTTFGNSLEPGYVEGKDAGSVSFSALSMQFAGDVIGKRIVGPQQRNPSQLLAQSTASWTRSYEQLPLGGLLRLDVAQAGQQEILLQSRSSLLASVDPSTSIVVPAEVFSNGITRADFGTAAGIRIPEGQRLELEPGSELIFRAGRSLDIGGEIIAPGGRIVSDGRNQGGGAAEIILREEAHIDVRGQWINDAADSPKQSFAPLFIDGGSVTLISSAVQEGALILEQGSIIDASGGALLQRGGNLETGRGGNITIGTRRPAEGEPNQQIRLDGELRSYALREGGSLNVFADSIAVASSSLVGSQLTIAPEFFSQGGFSSYSLTAQDDDIIIASNTAISPRAVNFRPFGNLTTYTTGSDLYSFTTFETLHDTERLPVDLEFTLRRPSESDVGPLARIELGAGARIDGDAGANIAFNSDGSIFLHGSVYAPAGTITANIAAPQGQLRADQSFLPEQGIWIGPTATLAAPAIAELITGPTGLRSGEVLSGGTISLTANRGYIVAYRGSVLDVSGAAATIDVLSEGGFGAAIYEPLLVAGAAGNISLTAAEGILLNSELRGHAAQVAGAAAGNLSISMDPGNRGGLDPANADDAPFFNFASGPRVIALGSDVGPTVALGQPIDNILNGLAIIDTTAVSRGGFDSIHLAAHSIANQQNSGPLSGSGARIRFDGDISLNVKRQLTLDAPVLATDGGSAALSAAYIAIGSTNIDYREKPAPITGTGRLNVDAQFIDLIGDVTLQGFGSGTAATPAVVFSSSGDIRLRGIEVPATSAALFGSFNVADDVLFRAAQIYTSTLSDYTIWAQGADSHVIFEDNEETAPTPLSAASRLTVAAANIDQRGSLKAPFGEIRFGNFVVGVGNQAPQFVEAANITLGTGSLTSVSGSGAIIPLGQIEFGREWVYKLGIENIIFNRPPDKLVSLLGQSVVTEAGAIVDVSGGGDLFAYEFSPGPGGSTDILRTDRNGESFAVLPGLNSGFAPYDPIESLDADIGIGDQVYLSGTDGLPAGNYTVLPARYALLPGAFLVTPIDGHQDLQPSQNNRQLDGSALISGYRTVAGTDIRDSRSSGFRVESGDVVRSRAEYTESLASSYFATALGTSPLPKDAGRLQIGAARNLELNASLVALGVNGGRGAQLDITAEEIAIVNVRSGSNTGAVEIVASELNGLGTESVMLGALRSSSEEGIALDVKASNVSVRAGAVLQGPEVILVADNAVTLESGSVLESTGSAAVAGFDYMARNGSALGIGAFARVSNGTQASVETGPNATGRTTIESGAVIRSSGSVTLTASGDTVSRGVIQMAGGSLSLGASAITIGDAENTAVQGLQLSEDDLAQLAVDELILRSSSSVELYGELELGFRDLIVDAQGIRGHQQSGQRATISAQRVTLMNTHTTSGLPVGQGDGELSVNANEVTFAPGVYSITGYGSVAFNADSVRGMGDTTLNVSGNLSVRSNLITAMVGADTAIDVLGSATFSAGSAAPVASADDALGARFALTAEEIDFGGHIRLASGEAILRSRGAGGLTVRPSAPDAVAPIIDVAGRDRVFADVVVGSPGGRITLLADNGPILLASNSRFDVSAGLAGGDAGDMRVSAPNGTVELASSLVLRGMANSAQRGASLQVDAGSLAGVDVGAIGSMANAGGFTESLHLHLRNGDIVLGANDVLRAHEIALTADRGGMEIFGTLDASGSQAGRVVLSAANDVVVHGTARIDAYATGPDERGGEVVLSTTAGAIDIRPTVARSGETSSYSINVAGTRAIEDDAGNPLLDTNNQPMIEHGSVRIRAPRTATNDGVSIAGLGGQITGAERVTIEAVRIYDTYLGAPISIIDSGLIASIEADTEAFQQNSATILTTLGVAADARYEVAPGIEIQSPDSLTLAANWDLMSMHFNQGQDPVSGENIFTTERAVPGVVTLRAADGLYLQSSLSDGFARRTADELFLPLTRENIVDGRSFGIRLISGADLSSSDVTAVRAGDGDLIVGSNVLVRTGTGDIELVAGGDIRMTDTTSAIYSAGRSSGIGTMPAELALFFLPGAYPRDGGDVRIHAEGSVYGPPSDQTNQLITEWLHRSGGPMAGFPEFPTAWAIQFTDPFDPSRSLFRQNVGSFGGGNISISARGDIDSFSAVLPTTGQQVGDVAFDLSSTSLTIDSNRVRVRGGGDLNMHAGGDILGGVYYLGRGEARLRAGGSITALDPNAASGHPVLALGDAQINMQARDTVTLQAAFNPTVLLKNAVQNQSGENSYFFTYSPHSAVRMTSIAGDIRILNETESLAPLIGATAGDTDATASFRIYPATFAATSLEGSVLFENPAGSLRMTTFPSASGGVTLLANQDVRAVNGPATVIISDADANLWPSIDRPARDNLASILEAVEHSQVPVHSGDPQPSRIVARTGVVGSIDTFNVLSLNSAEPVRVFAGLDVFNFVLKAQHIDAGDISIVQAGRDVVFPTIRSPLPPASVPADTAIRSYRGGFLGNSTNALEIAGPGEFQVFAGRDIDLGTAVGIRTVGNLFNPVLPSDGADLLLMAGLAFPPDYNGFINEYLVGSTNYIQRLSDFLTTNGVGTTNDPIASFRGLSLERQRQLLFDIFFSELRASGVAAATGGSKEYARGFQAIETLFPTDRRYAGDMSLILSRIATLDGGNMQLLVPGGFINAGLATTESLSKPASELGIVAQRAGDIEAFVYDDLVVNQSRIFALDGGNISIWSSVGDIDAGRGAKTAISAPPPTVTIDADGNVVVEFPPAISGSGIRGAVTTPGREPGNVYLFAPAGVVDAGDAGIGSAGDVVIAATKVIGADNIDVGGVAVGVPVETGGLGASLAGVSSVASSASAAAAAGVDSSAGKEEKAPLASSALSWLDVFVVGLGEESCKQDDIECLKRQQTRVE